MHVRLCESVSPAHFENELYCRGLRQELVEYRAKYFTGPGQAPPPILALGLSSRKNLCVHPTVAGAPCCHDWQFLQVILKTRGELCPCVHRWECPAFAGLAASHSYGIELWCASQTRARARVWIRRAAS